MADRPILEGSARVRKSSSTVPTSHIAREPTNRSLEMATSTRAMSRISPSTKISRRLLAMVVSSRETFSHATTPAASPAIVPSTISGNTLLVPVDTATNGMFREPLATARFVPSPPSVIRHPTSMSAIMPAARVESRSSLKTGISRNSTESEKLVLSRAPRPRAAMSGIMTTRSTPTASRPAKIRLSMFTFSWLGTNRPWATSRRMSLPAAGFAIMPTVAKG